LGLLLFSWPLGWLAGELLAWGLLIVVNLFVLVVVVVVDAVVVVVWWELVSGELAEEVLSVGGVLLLVELWLALSKDPPSSASEAAVWQK